MGCARGTWSLLLFNPVPHSLRVIPDKARRMGSGAGPRGVACARPRKAPFCRRVRVGRPVGGCLWPVAERGA
jgi:hypothetical protein